MGQVLWQTLRVWWRELIAYAVVNVAWVGLTLSVIGAPPALAAMYQIARGSLDGDPVEPRQYLAVVRRLFWPAWRWGLLQIAVYGLIAFNFLYYSYSGGTIWTVLRLLWFAGLIVWTLLNLFYWPFFLAQADRRIATTYRNAAVFAGTRPVLAGGVAVLTVLTVLGSAATVVLFAFAVMPLTSLLASDAVRGELSRFTARNAVESE